MFQLPYSNGIHLFPLFKSQATCQNASGDIQETFSPFAGVYEELQAFAEDVSKCVVQVVFTSLLDAMIRLVFVRLPINMC